MALEVVEAQFAVLGDDRHAAPDTRFPQQGKAFLKQVIEALTRLPSDIEGIAWTSQNLFRVAESKIGSCTVCVFVTSKREALKSLLSLVHDITISLSCQL
ncbi:hypothetical protein [Skermanella aerolata]|uniref:hypothetical protein n=1 Tax=Skermanella aerolata TaxID=393310 RepID=UPI0014707C4F|nr:hypothetical protein [Skermanella aerolata]